MAITFVDNASFEIKSGVVFADFMSDDQPVKLAFPISEFRMMIEGGREALASFDLDRAVVAFQPKPTRKNGSR